jgi:phospholipid/cholesterol/gamma-HCH transport system substrate-binding protein
MPFLKDEIKAGLIIAGSFLILSAFVIVIGGSQLFAKSDYYFIKLKNVTGLEDGSQVRLGGLRVGKVIRVSAPEKAGDPITVTLAIDKGTPLYKGTTAFISQIGFVGDIFLQLSFINASGELIPPGSEIPSEEKIEFASMMTKMESLAQTTENLLKDVNKVFSAKNIKNVEQIIAHTDKAIVSGSANVEKMLTSLKNTSDKLGVVLSEVEDTIKANKGELSATLKKARETIEQANSMIRSIEQAAKKADNAIDIQSQNIDALLGALTKTAGELTEAIQDLKAKPWSVIYKDASRQEE